MSKFLSLVLLLFSALTFASGYNKETLITDVQVGGDKLGVLKDVAYITVDGITTPKCVDLNRMYINLATPLGKSQLSVALMAYASKSIVRVDGAEACFEDDVTSVEELKTIRLR